MKSAWITRLSRNSISSKETPVSQRKACPECDAALSTLATDDHWLHCSICNQLFPKSITEQSVHETQAAFAAAESAKRDALKEQDFFSAQESDVSGRLQSWKEAIHEPWHLKRLPSVIHSAAALLNMRFAQIDHKLNGSEGGNIFSGGVFDKQVRKSRRPEHYYYESTSRVQLENYRTPDRCRLQISVETFEGPKILGHGRHIGVSVTYTLSFRNDNIFCPQLTRTYEGKADFPARPNANIDALAYKTATILDGFIKKDIKKLVENGYVK